MKGAEAVGGRSQELILSYRAGSGEDSRNVVELERISQKRKTFASLRVSTIDFARRSLLGARA